MALFQAGGVKVTHERGDIVAKAKQLLLKFQCGPGLVENAMQLHNRLLALETAA